ncbi:ATP-citrate synthase, partial [Emergomyces africanus]
GDWILFTHEGGVDVGDVDAKAEKLLIPVNLKNYPSNDEIAAALLSKIPQGLHNVLVDFITRLYAVYVDCQFTYLEINPLVVIPNAAKTSAAVHFLDLAAKLDQTAEFECGTKWAIARSPAALGTPKTPNTDGRVTIDAGPPMEFPAPFGRELSKEEKFIADMDAKTGASLKLTVLTPTAASGPSSPAAAPPSYTPTPSPLPASSPTWPTTASTPAPPPRRRRSTTPARFWT